MPRSTADARGWTQPRRRAGRRTVLALLLTSILGGLFVTAPPQVARADDLADAIARQQATEAQIAKQKAQVAALAKRQATLSGELARTKASLAEINADLTAVRTQVVRMTVEVADVEARARVLGDFFRLRR